MQRWAGKVAVVTGSCEGIGESIVRRLVSHGMKVFAIARNDEPLTELENSINTSAERKVIGKSCDVTNSEQVSATFKQIEESVGQIHVLVNNSETLQAVDLTNIDLATVENLWSKHVTGTINCIKFAIDNMKRHKMDEGHIISISSMAAHTGTTTFPEYAVFGCTKITINELSKNLASRLRAQNMKTRVSVVSPSLVKTKETITAVPDCTAAPHLLPDDVATAVEYALAAPAHVNVSAVLLESV